MAAATSLSMDLEALKDQPGQLKRIGAGLGYVIHGLIFEPRLPRDASGSLGAALGSRSDLGTCDPVEMGIKRGSVPSPQLQT